MPKSPARHSPVGAALTPGFKSYHKFAKQSIEEKKKDRYQKAMNAYKDFIQEFPESQYLSEAKSLKGRAEKEMELLYQKDQAINSNINKK